MINAAWEGQSALIDEACHELLTYGVWDWKKRARRLIKKYLLGRPVPAEDLIFWPTGLLAAGLWECRQRIVQETVAAGTVQETAAAGAGTLQEAAGTGATQETGADALRQDTENSPGADRQTRNTRAAETVKRIDTALSAYYGRWMKKDFPAVYLDDLLAGETLLSIYEAHQKIYDKEHKDVAGEKETRVWSDIITVLNQDRLSCTMAVEGLAKRARFHTVDETGSFPYRETNGSKMVLVDTIGLACPFLYRYGQDPEKEYAMEVAVKQIVNFLAYGMDAATGLPYHGYVVEDACKYGIIGWGRGVGWLLRGMTGCMTTLYGAEKLADSFKELADTVLGYQRRDGYFSWQLQAMDGPADTSATGMICVALKKGMELGMLEGELYELALQAGRQAIERSIKNGRVYDCSGECEGPGQYPQRYGAYPWALGPALMLYPWE